jgi:hypothetical protein
MMSAANRICHWTARLTGAFVSCGVLGVMLSQVTGPQAQQLIGPSRFENTLLGVILVSALALIGGWHHEVFGGTIAVAGGIILLAMPWSGHPELQPLWPLGLSFLVPGLLFLMSAHWPRRSTLIPH